MRAPRVVITARLYIGLIFGLTFGLILGMPTVANVATYPSLSVQRVVASGFETPWGLAFLPDGSALVSERDTGKIKRIDPSARAGTNVKTIGRINGVTPGGEGGLLGIAVATPQGSSTPVLFAYLTSATDNRVVRMPLLNGGKRLGAQKTIVTGIPKATYHNGGRLLVGADQTLYIATGDAGDPQLSQDPDSLAGKVLRVDFSGAPAAGNPRAKSPVFTVGHRNVQGLALDSKGRVWASEFGERDADELNLLVPGGNYGWPEVEGRGQDPRFINPRTVWSPTSTASPSGIAIKNDVVYVASLRGERLWQVPITGATTRKAKSWDIGNAGRLRTIAVAPDGSLWVVTSNTDGRGDPRPSDDKIIRLLAR
jgi:glucose/arabinose dehydrogenase